MGCTNCSKVLNPPKVVGLIAPVNAAHRSQRCHCLFACRWIHSRTLSLKERRFLLLSNPWTNINPHGSRALIYTYCQLFYFSPESLPNVLDLLQDAFLGQRLQLQARHFILFPLPFVHFPFCSCCLLLAIHLLSSFHHDPKSLNIDYIPCITTLTFSGDKVKKQRSHESLYNFTFLFCVSGWNVAINSPLLLNHTLFQVSLKAWQTFTRVCLCCWTSCIKEQVHVTDSCCCALCAFPPGSAENVRPCNVTARLHRRRLCNSSLPMDELIINADMWV